MKSFENVIRQLKPRWRTKTDFAYEVIREAIHTGLFAPGEHILAKAVAKELGMSLIPVREALRRLETEGLVNIRAHAGATVRPFPAEELAELVIIRGELEGFATRLATPRLTEESLNRLEVLLDEMDRCIQDGELELAGPLNRQFHLTIYQAVPYRRLYRLIESLWDEIPRALSLHAIVPKYAEESQAEHREILAALRSRDSARAERLIRQHKLTALQALGAEEQLQFL